MIETEIKHFLREDLVFKVFFTRKENEEILKELISMSIGIKSDDITKITILNPELFAYKNGSKSSVLDLLVQINDKEEVNIELQNTNEHNIIPRIEFYQSRMYIKNIDEGEDYLKLKKVYGIYLLTYNDKNYRNFFSRIEECDTINMEKAESMKQKVIYNLTKFDQIDKYGFNEEQKNILRLIKSQSRKELEDMAVDDKKIKRAIKQLEEINADKELSKALYYIQKQRLDKNSAITYATREKDKIIEEKDNTLKVLIKALHDSGKTIEEISEITNLDMDYINQILK